MREKKPPYKSRRLEEPPPSLAVFYPDTNHKDLSVRKKLFDVLFENARQQNIKHIAVETPTFFQIHVDDYYNEKITEEDFIKEFKNAIDPTSGQPDEGAKLNASVIQRARSMGIKVICADKHFQGITPREKKMLDEFLSLFKKISLENSKQLASLLFTKDEAALHCIRDEISKDPASKQFLDYLEKHPEINKLLERRLKQDGGVAKYIKEKVGNDNVAVVYGAKHLEKGGIPDHFKKALFYDSRNKQYANTPPVVDYSDDTPFRCKHMQKPPAGP